MNNLQTFLKVTLKAIFWIVTVFVLIFIVIGVLIQIPGIQNKIIHKVTSYVSNKTHTKVEIKNISISFPKSIVIKGLFLNDLQKDTLIYAGKVKMNIVFKNLLLNKISVNNFTLENVNLNINRIATDSLFNYNFLFTAFSNGKNQINVKPQAKSKWTFSIDKVNLKNIRLHYNDEYGGTNVAAFLGNIELKMNAIDLDKSFYSIDKLLVESINANVQMIKPANANEQKTSSVLPKILANNIEINNSTLAYRNSINKQSIIARINRFALKDGSVDLQKEIVIVGKLKLSKSVIYYNTNNTGLVSETKIAVPSTTENNWKVTVKSIDLDDNSLAYRVGNKPEIKNVFDVNQLKYKHLTIAANNLYYSSARTVISIKEFSTIDQNNFSITKFETEFSMDQHSITAKKLKAKTPNSSIDADLYLHYSSLKALKDSMPFMFMNIDMRNVSIKNSDILYFNPQLFKQPFFKNLTNITTVSGIVNGRVNNLKGKNLVIKIGAKTILKTNFSITGLPNVKTAYFNFPNLKIKSSKRDILMIAGPLIPKSIALPEDINMLIVFKGKIKAFESTMGLRSSFGDALVLASIDQKENFRSKVSMTSFNLGSLLKDTAMYGPVTLTAEANGQGFDIKMVKAKVKAEVSQIYLKKYTYHNLKVDGNISGQVFDGKIILNDENAVFNLDGFVNLNPNQEHYRFRLNVQEVDLQKLNLTKADLKIGMVVVADFKGGSLNKLKGKTEISNMIVMQGGKKYFLDSLLHASINEPTPSEFKFNSALIGIKYSGTTSPLAFLVDLNNFINNYFPISDANSLKKESEQSNFNFEIQLHNHPILSQALLPQLKEFETGLIKGSFDSREKDLKLNAAIKRVVYGTTEIKDFVMDINSNSTALNYKISSSNISTAQIKLDNFLFDGKLENKIIFANISSIADNQNKKILIRSQIKKDNTNYKLALDPKNFYLMNNRWDISADNYIEFGKEGFLIHHFFINNGEKQINVASVNDKFNDDLSITIKNFKLDDISRIIEKDTSLVKGIVDGNVLLKRVNNTYGIIADAKISNLFVRDIPVGNLTLKADNPTAQKFDVDVNLSGSGNNLTSKGYFITNEGNNSISINTTIQSLSMKTIEAFSMGQITEASGNLTGNILIQGITKAPEITGELVFNNVFIKPAVLNNRLELKNETIQLNNDGIYFKSFTLLDVNQHTAIIDGSVKMKQFKDYICNLQVNTKDFLLFNSTIRDNQEFFGRMVIDSKIDISGSLTLPIVNGVLKMKKGSNFTFITPANKLSADKGENVVEFVDPLKLNSVLPGAENKAVQKASFTGLNLAAIVEIDKQATLRLLMDPSSTDSLVVKGEAALSFTMNRSGEMSLTGSYNLEQGSYLVSLESVIKKKFNINAGSTINWNGDPMNADITINASYSVQAAPYDLMAAQMSGMSDAGKGEYKQRYPFSVLLKLRGEILHPVISFEIQLAPENKGILGGAVNQKLNMLNENVSDLNKQVFALLVLGRFVQENPFQTESGGTSTLIRSTVSNFLSSELNKLSSKFVPDVELNFNVQSYDDYQTGQAQGRTQVAIGIKKQLFDERLSVQVGGTVDVEGDKSNQNTASDITSDITVEYKLTEDGRFRLKGFRQNLYEGAIEGQLVETGVGVSYVRDFNKWKNIFKASKKNSKVLKK